MSKASFITKKVIRPLAVVALAVGALGPVVISASNAGADPKAPAVKVPFPVHPRKYVPTLIKVTATQEQDCTHPTGKVHGTWYCGGYVTNTSLTFNKTAIKVTKTQVQDCTYPVGDIGGTWYCGNYAPTN